MSLDRGGYVPGETIGISATVSNRSKVYTVINVANECNFDILNNLRQQLRTVRKVSLKTRIDR